MEIENMFFISEDNWNLLQAWAQLSYDEDKNEISGLMTAVPQKDGRFELKDVEILKQENTTHTTELDGDAVTEYKMKHAMKYKNEQLKFVWWHSHHTMGAFWSGTDLKEINAWKNSSFSLALVINLRQEYVFRVSLWNAHGFPLEQHYDTSLDIQRSCKPVITNSMKKQYEELCENESKVITHTGYGHTYGGYQTNLLAKKNNKDIDNYNDLIKKLEDLNDKFMSDEVKFNAYIKELKNLKSICDKNKLDYTVIIPKTNKMDTINGLMYQDTDDLIEFKDNTVKWNYQQKRDWYYGGWN